MRGEDSDSNLVPSTATILFPLASFETLYGAQLIGATIMRIRGTVAVQNNGSVGSPTSPIQSLAFGWWHQPVDFGDMALNQPNPIFGPANNDRFYRWMYIDNVPAFQSNVPSGFGVDPTVTYRYDARAKRKMQSVGDNLILAHAASRTGASALSYTHYYSILVALP